MAPNRQPANQQRGAEYEGQGDAEVVERSGHSAALASVKGFAENSRDAYHDEERERDFGGGHSGCLPVQDFAKLLEYREALFRFFGGEFALAQTVRPVDLGALKREKVRTLGGVLQTDVGVVGGGHSGGLGGGCRSLLENKRNGVPDSFDFVVKKPICQSNGCACYYLNNVSHMAVWARNTCLPVQHGNVGDSNERRKRSQ